MADLGSHSVEKVVEEVMVDAATAI